MGQKHTSTIVTDELIKKQHKVNLRKKQRAATTYEPADSDEPIGTDITEWIPYLEQLMPRGGPSIILFFTSGNERNVKKYLTLIILYQNKTICSVFLITIASSVHISDNYVSFTSDLWLRHFSTFNI